MKPATLENGSDVMVPQFVKAGDVIRLDLQSMKVHGSGQDEAECETRLSLGAVPVLTQQGPP
jgi:hypothetical protein